MQKQIDVVAAVICRGDRYLVAQRPLTKRHGGKWEFPGGKLHPDETIQAGLARELKEELAVDVCDIGMTTFTVDDEGSIFRIRFVYTVIAGEPRLLEHTSIAWLTLVELNACDLAPSDALFVEQLNRTLK